MDLPEASKFEPAINKDTERMIWYVSGMSGSGKSHYTGNVLRKYKKSYPKNEIYLFSSVDEDKALDSLKPKRINLDGLLTEDLSSEDFADSCVIFDDCDCISNKHIKNKILAIQNQILEKGRHSNISCIVTSHITNDGNNTKKILNEAHRIVVFPSNMNQRSFKYLFDNYLGFGKEEIKYLKNIETRSLTICKTFPQVVFTDKMICFSKHLLSKTE
jgi:Cdc6-like AAA superfamily ATPase